MLIIGHDQNLKRSDKNEERENDLQCSSMSFLCTKWTIPQREKPSRSSRVRDRTVERRIILIRTIRQIIMFQSHMPSNWCHRRHRSKLMDDIAWNEINILQINYKDFFNVESKKIVHLRYHTATNEHNESLHDVIDSVFLHHTIANTEQTKRKVKKTNTERKRVDALEKPVVRKYRFSVVRPLFRNLQRGNTPHLWQCDWTWNWNGERERVRESIVWRVTYGVPTCTALRIPTAAVVSTPLPSQWSLCARVRSSIRTSRASLPRPG